MIQFSIEVASEKHIPYVKEILYTIEEAAKDRGTGIAKRNFRHEATTEQTLSHYTHEGSIGNLCNEQIKAKMIAIIHSIPLSSISKAIEKLLNQ
jgi:hypothetical protein